MNRCCSTLPTLILQFWCTIIISIPVENRKVLFIPTGNLSQFIEMHGLGRELLRRGHEVSVLLSKGEMLPDRAISSGYQVINHKGKSLMPTEDEEQFFITLNPTIIMKMIFSKEGPLQNLKEKVIQNCRGLIRDKETLENIQKEHFDFAVINFLNGCGFILAYYFNLEYAAIFSGIDIMTPRWAILPSIHRGILGLMTESMMMPFGNGYSFMDRLVRLIAAIFSSYMVGHVHNTLLEDITTELNISITPSIIASKSALFFVNYEPLFSVDPLPEQPNLLITSGIGTEPSRPLKNEQLMQFADGSNEGLVVFSMGSFISAIPIDMVLKVLTAVAPLKQRMVMRLHNKTTEKLVEQSKIPENVLILNWLPQNDLLGHKNTVLFVSHCGNNGLLEALYHGVPILAIPLFGDEIGNAHEVVARGFGQSLDHKTFTADEFRGAVVELVNNKSYRSAIKKASAIFHSRQPPGERAADAIEHVIKFGSKHLRPHAAYELSIWEIYMFDIFFVVCSVLLLMLVLCYCFIRCIASSVGNSNHRSSSAFKKKDD